MGEVNNADISSEVVLDIVRKENLEKYKVICSDYDSKDGYVGLPFKLTVEGVTPEGDQKTFHLFCKKASTLKCLRDIFPVNVVFKREKFMYTVVFEEFARFERRKGVKVPFTDNVPRCFKANVVDMNEYVAMSDLTKSGYVLWNREKLMDDVHLRMVLREIARFHALSLAYRDQQRENFKVIEKGCGSMKWIYEESRFNEVLEEKCKRTSKMLDGDIDTVTYEKFKRFAYQECGKWLRDFTDPAPNEMVILHGDCWSNNLMFLYEDDNQNIPKKVAFIDWQISRLGSPAIDLSYFLFSSCSKESLDKMPELLKVYYDSLSSYVTELGSDADALFPYSTLERHWKEYLKFGLILSTVVVHSLVIKSPDEMPSYQELADTGKPLINVFLFESASDESNKEYQRRIKDVIKYCAENNFI